MGTTCPTIFSPCVQGVTSKRTTLRLVPKKKLASMHLDSDLTKLNFAFFGSRINQITHAADVNIRIDFDNKSLNIHDNQSCCESRYFTIDDDLRDFSGSTFYGLEIREAPNVFDEGDNSHEIMFLVIKTDNGELVVCSHNEHNGYYGGFSLYYNLTDRK